jgi:dephospho-CoA kinase
MCEARGEKIVRSVPRSRVIRHQPGELRVPVLLQGGRRRRVVAVAIDDHLRLLRLRRRSGEIKIIHIERTVVLPIPWPDFT